MGENLRNERVNKAIFYLFKKLIYMSEKLAKRIIRNRRIFFCFTQIENGI